MGTKVVTVNHQWSPFWTPGSAKGNYELISICASVIPFSWNCLTTFSIFCIKLGLNKLMKMAGHIFCAKFFYAQNAKCGKWVILQPQIKDFLNFSQNLFITSFWNCTCWKALKAVVFKSNPYDIQNVGKSHFSEFKINNFQLFSKFFFFSIMMIYKT